MRLAAIFSPADSPAEEPQAPGSERAWAMSRLLCGESLPESLASYDPDSSCWRTSRLSLLSTEGELTERFSETWPRSGMCARGTVYPLPPLVPRTSAIGGSSLLPTPCRRDWKGPGYKGQLPTELLPTPTSAQKGPASQPGASAEGGPSLNNILLPTPHGMPKEDQRRRPGPTGNELGRALTTLHHADASGESLTLADSAPAATPTSMIPEGFTPSSPSPDTSSSPALLPTPNASLQNYEEPVDQFMERRARLQEKHQNGNGIGLPLGVAMRMSDGEPTSPQSDDGKKSPAPLLNPSFVAWMLGMPAEWSDPDCPLTAMAFSARPGYSSASRSFDLTGERSDNEAA